MNAVLEKNLHSDRPKLDNFNALNEKEFVDVIAKRYFDSFNRSMLVSRDEHKEHLREMRVKRRNKNVI